MTVDFFAYGAGRIRENVCNHTADTAILARAAARFDNAKEPIITRTSVMNFDDIQGVGDLEAVSEESVWQNFERLAAYIFEKNDFCVKVNTIKTLNRKRRQYDVIARKKDRTFLVECKRWSKNRYRLSALKKAILQHKERTAFYESIMHEDAVPVIVTLIEEEIRVFEGIPIVPVLMLNSFIGELDNHAGVNFLSGYEEEILLPEDESGDFWELSGESGVQGTTGAQFRRG